MFYFLLFHLFIYWSCKFLSFTTELIVLNINIYINMFQLVCINSMALCKRLVLVNVNGCYSFPLKHAVGGFGAFTSGPQRREIFFFVLVLHRYCLRTQHKAEKEAQKLLWRLFFLLKSPPWEAWKGIWNEGRQSSRGRFIQGTRFSREDWPLHPWPAGQAAFSLPGV